MLQLICLQIAVDLCYATVRTVTASRRPEHRASPYHPDQQAMQDIERPLTWSAPGEQKMRAATTSCWAPAKASLLVGKATRSAAKPGAIWPMSSRPRFLQPPCTAACSESRAVIAAAAGQARYAAVRVLPSSAAVPGPKGS